MQVPEQDASDRREGIRYAPDPARGHGCSGRAARAVWSVASDQATSLVTNVLYNQFAMGRANSPRPKAEAQVDRAFAALADPTRRAILRQLRSGQASVNVIASRFAISQPAISRHLRVLEEAGLIETDRDGQQRPRRLRPQGLALAQRFIQDMASHWPDRLNALATFLDQTKDPT
jgi:DNA-binding transcriptional ArsR family regulator